MDERRTELIRASAKFAGIEYDNYEVIEKGIDDMVKMSGRYLDIYCLPGAAMCVSFALFLAYSFGLDKNSAFMEEKFYRKDGVGFGRLFGMMNTSKTADNGLTTYENMAMGMAVELVGQDGDLDRAMGTGRSKIAEMMEFADGVLDATSSISAFLEENCNVVILKKLHEHFMSSYSRFVSDFSEYYDNMDETKILLEPLSEENMSIGIGEVLTSVLMLSVESNAPLDVFEGFWRKLLMKDNIKDTLHGYSENAQRFIEEIQKKLDEQGKEGEESNA